MSRCVLRSGRHDLWAPYPHTYASRPHLSSTPSAHPTERDRPRANHDVRAILPAGWRSTTTAGKGKACCFAWTALCGQQCSSQGRLITRGLAGPSRPTLQDPSRPLEPGTRRPGGAQRQLDASSTRGRPAKGTAARDSLTVASSRAHRKSEKKNWATYGGTQRGGSGCTQPGALSGRAEPRKTPATRVS